MILSYIVRVMQNMTGDYRSSWSPQENMGWCWTIRNMMSRATLSSSLDMFMTNTEPIQIHWGSVPSRKCMTHRKMRASALLWNGNISLTIHPTTIFSQRNTQRTAEDWCGILLEHHISSDIWQTQIIGMWGHNNEVLQHKETTDNPSECIWQGTRSCTHPGW